MHAYIHTHTHMNIIIVPIHEGLLGVFKHASQICKRSNQVLQFVFIVLLVFKALRNAGDELHSLADDKFVNITVPACICM